MAYNDNTGRLRRDSGSSRPRQQSSRPPITPGGGAYHGPRGTRQRGGGLKGPSRKGPGYPVRARSINFQNGRTRIFGIDRQLFILGALAIVLLVLIIVGVSSCVRSCSSSEPAGETNPVDARVAAGVSEELTNEFATELNRSEKLSAIAASADRYSDQGLLELALTVPEAIDFVAAYPDAEKTAQPYEDAVEQGVAPQLWCWDARWGAVDYAGHPLAVSGSGPTVVSMAYMGLTGKSDKSPADIAQAVTEAELASGDSAMSADYLSSAAEGLGVAYASYVSNGDNLSQMLDTGTYLLIEAKAGTLTDTAHWVLLVSENEDGSVVVYDPTSPEVSAHPWAPATLAASCDNLYAFSSSDATTDDAE
ncbi:hypothetical protein NW198_00055 [Thermophilibacter sp. ET337]|uniref:hypothetical protein n=1 Tax=Thermophilibacter sp. ET337 TaxID=2973084 RepID=UPI0021ACB7D1|nr:hypothetical protein [Thermophilibacter sp. ET337]MCR8907013.1 hypothetical protein [Thermophilibacter sp. ET337]